MTEEKIKLRDYLFQFLSDNKQSLFNEKVNHRMRHITVVLEDIYQSHNASAVLRSADIFGVQDIHIIENNHLYEVNPDVALGSAKWLDLIRHNEHDFNTVDCFNKLKAKGYTIVATSPHKDDVLIEDLPINRKTALVFGTELHGLSSQAMQSADAFVKIPMYGFTESFNISVSAALSLYSFTTRLRNSNVNWALSDEEKIDIQIEWAKKSIKKVDLILEKYFSHN